MSDTDKHKQIVRDFIQVVWRDLNLNALADFWTQDCVNHAMLGPDNQGLDALRSYHESSFADFAAFSEVQMEIRQQIGEGDTIVTYIASSGKHSGGTFYGIPPTGKQISTSVMRIDRFQDGKIAEHWSVSDAASLMLQLQAS